MKYIYLECPACQFSSVLREVTFMPTECPLCAGDTGYSVIMNKRPVRDDDMPEGVDERKLND